MTHHEHHKEEQERDGNDEHGERPPPAREVQEPIGEYRSPDGTWLSGDEEDDSLRDEAAERASRAVEPDRPRE